MVPLCPKIKNLAWSSLAHMLRSPCLPPSPRWAPSCKLFPLYAHVSPVFRAEKCKPCPVALVPTLGCSRPLPPGLLLLASALSGNIRPGYVFFFLVKRFSHSDRSGHPAREIYTHRVNHARRSFRFCLDEPRRESAGRFTPGCTHDHAPMSRSEAETAQGGAPPNPTLVRFTCVLLLLLLYVAATAAVVPLLLRLV